MCKTEPYEQREKLRVESDPALKSCENPMPQNETYFAILPNEILNEIIELLDASHVIECDFLSSVWKSAHLEECETETSNCMWSTPSHRETPRKQEDLAYLIFSDRSPFRNILKDMFVDVWAQEGQVIRFSPTNHCMQLSAWVQSKDNTVLLNKLRGLEHKLGDPSNDNMTLKKILRDHGRFIKKIVLLSVGGYMNDFYNNTGYMTIAHILNTFCPEVEELVFSVQAGKPPNFIECNTILRNFGRRLRNLHWTCPDYSQYARH